MRLRIAAITSVTLVLSVFVLGTNYFDVLTRTSDDFSLDAFHQFDEGDSIQAAINALGEPLRVFDAGACDGCKAYLFQGDYPSWSFGGSESWYVCDPQGTILSRMHLKEP